MTITQHKANELFEKLVEAQAPVSPERLAEIQVAAEAGWELAGDYIHLARAWLGSQQALRDVIAENAALRARVEEWERKSKNNGLAAAIGLERMQELEGKIILLRNALTSAMHALNSYAYGNQSTELAEEVAERLFKELNE